MVGKMVTGKQFRLTSDELGRWDRDGYLVRLNVFSMEENDVLRQVAEDIVDGKRPFPIVHIDHNALIGVGNAERTGIYAMHKIHHPSSYSTEFLFRTRDPRLTDPLVDLLGPDLLGINNLFIWKSPEIGLGFPWHQDKFYFRSRFRTETTVGTWMSIDVADQENGCLYVIPGSHKKKAVHDFFPDSNNLAGQGQTTRDVDESEAVYAKLRAGQVVFHHESVVHSSLPNKADRPRIGFSIHYCAPHVRETRFDGATAMLLRGEDPYGYWKPDPMPKTDFDPDCIQAMLDYRQRFKDATDQKVVDGLRT